MIKRRDLVFPSHPTVAAPNSRLFVQSGAAPSPAGTNYGAPRTTKVSNTNTIRSPIAVEPELLPAQLVEIDSVPIVRRQPSSASIGSVRPESMLFVDAQSEIDSDSESEASESDASEDNDDLSAPEDPIDDPLEDRTEETLNGKNVKQPKRSRPAMLVLESMAKPASPTKKRKNISLDHLTLNDVNLTEADLKLDIQEIWTAM